MNYRTLIRAAALYDLILAAPLAVPGGVGWMLGLIGPLNVALGGEPFPTLSGVPLLFAQLMGSLILTWAVLRLVWPRWQLGVADAASRGLFSVHYALLVARGGHPLGWFLLVPELLWGLAQTVGAAVYREDELSTDRKTHS